MKSIQHHHSIDRQDDLLQRLKNCVGQIQIKHNEISNSARKQIQLTNSKQNYQINFDDSLKPSTKRYEHNTNDYRQNYNSRDFIRQEKMKSSRDTEGQNVLQRTKKPVQIEQNISKQYWTDRKRSLPLNQVSNLLNLNQNNIEMKAQESKSKNVTESTKKKILQRASLIDSDMQGITPRKSFAKQIAKDIHQKPFFDTQIQTKILYGLQKEDNLNETKKTPGKNSLLNNIDTSSERGKNKTKDLIIESQALIPSKKSDFLQKMKSQKLDNYSKFSMENLVKENDFRKVQKLEKLKKITEINEGINNRIRKLVDNFQNYLTHRVIS